MTDASAVRADERPDKVLFWGCFLALIATAFAFIVRAMLIDTWGDAYSLTQTEKGQIFGVGLWPFAISIVLFSLIIDKIGYGWAMLFAFVCHVSSAIMTIYADDYWSLWVATFIVALGNGTVEAVINPVVATMFRHDKTKWLNILHAGWPGGLVLGGLLALVVGQKKLDAAGEPLMPVAYANWEVMVGLLLVPTVIYGLLLLRRRFPVQERVAAGVSQREMLGEVGGLGMLIVTSLIALEICGVAGINGWIGFTTAVVVSVGFTAYTQSLGRPLFIFLLLIMIPLATTELGVDGWVTPLMNDLQDPVLVLMYTAFIMMVLRFSAGPIVHRLSPLGLLAASATIAGLGLIALSQAVGVAMIFGAATLYALGKTFFWPTMLGVVSERFPRGGAMAINATGGVGMLSVGIVGAVFLGLIQDKATVADLQAKHPAIAARVVAEKGSVFGDYLAVDPDQVKAQPPADQEVIASIGKTAQKGALSTAAVFPAVMLLCYLGLILYFRSQGGYRAVQLE